ncbi:MAG: DNA methyltransferase [candidate division WOR-3 bacterium]
MKTSHRIIIGDARCMKEVAAESVHLVVTSPPYWQLKDYGDQSQIGFNDTYEEYINHLNLVWNECYRVLHQGCRLCINIGDQFARSVYYGRYKIIPIRTEIIKFCETRGFDYMGAIVWQKVTTCNTTGGATVMGSFPYPRNGIVKLDYEFILIFRKPGAAPRVSREVKEQSRMTQDEWNQYFAGHWNFPGERQEGHLAMFPEELPRRLIRMFSFRGDTVLDPFLGSGTTTLVARRLERNSIGYEVNPSFVPFIKDKVGIGRSFLDNADCSIETQAKSVPDFERAIGQLPYIFRDPIKVERRLDPKRLNFGSRIDTSAATPETYYRVKEVVSPVELILDNNLRIRLLAIREDPDRTGQALEYLCHLVTGQRVFMRYDSVKYDEQGRLLCYLYLRNKTFVNARLIRQGLVAVEGGLDYRLKSRFLSLKASA